MSRRLPALLIAVLVAVLLGLWFLSDDEPASPAASAPLEVAPPDSGTARPVEARTPVEVEPEPVVQTEAQPPVDEVAVVHAPLEPWTVNGTIVLIDAQGVEHAQEDGEFRASFDSFHTIEVRRGRWSVDLAEPVPSLRIGSITLGGRGAFLEGSDYRTARIPAGFGPGSTLELRAREIARSRVRVVDAQTDLDLAGVLVLHPGNLGATREHPGSLEGVRPLAESAASPIEFPIGYHPGRSRVLYHFFVEGYAWAGLEIDHQRGGQRVVPMVPGGDLRVRLAGPGWTPALWVTVEHAEDGREAVAFQVGEREAIEIDGLRVGDYRVHAARGEYQRERLGSTEAVVRAGRAGEVTLELGSVETKTVPLAGTLRVPAAWELDEPQLHRTFSGEGQERGRNYRVHVPAEREGSDPELWHWDAGEVAPGTWWLGLDRPSFSVEVPLGPEGDGGVALELPPPAQVLVTVSDEATGAPLDIVPNWTSSVEGPPRTHSRGRARPTSTPGLFEFTAPQGQVQITIDDPERVATPIEARVVSAREAFELLVRKPTLLDLRMYDGEAALSWSGVEPALVAWLGTSPPIHALRKPRGLSLIAVLPDGGRVRVTPGPVPGYRTAPPFEVELNRGERKVAEIHLERED